MNEPGLVILMGSGETAAVGGQVFEAAAQDQRARGPRDRRLRICLLETPAGFETNASRVAGRVGDFMSTRLQNYPVDIQLIPARKKGSRYSPDAPEVIEPLYSSDIIFAGPGSPTYAVRQLEDSLAWQIIQARQQMGAALILASAAAIAAGMFALPVYEIFKAGEDPHWKPGLDFFQRYGLKLVIVSHWNNREGGSEVDTSRCFMGQERFNELLALLPADATVLGIDEHTALTIDTVSGDCQVTGTGEVHVITPHGSTDFASGSHFDVAVLGSFHLPETVEISGAEIPSTGISAQVWQRAQGENTELAGEDSAPPPADVLRLVEARQAARQAKDWPRADHLRQQIEAMGWLVTDTPGGPQMALKN
jgi:cyanophycinase-like exopeptidase